VKLYAVRFHDRDHGATLAWFPSLATAKHDLAEKRRRAKMLGLEPSGAEQVEPIEVPTDRTGLLHWLNTNFNRDNG
jgi:hypothetical protein